MALTSFESRRLDWRGRTGLLKAAQNVFMNGFDEFVVVYLDGTSVYSKSKELHFQHLPAVFQRTREPRVFAKLSKRESATQRVQYLGFVTEPGQAKPDPDKVSPIKEWPAKLTDKSYVGSQE